jgi:hypothetical protein
MAADFFKRAKTSAQPGLADQQMASRLLDLAAALSRSLLQFPSFLSGYITGLSVDAMEKGASWMKCNQF